MQHTQKELVRDENIHKHISHLTSENMQCAGHLKGFNCAISIHKERVSPDELGCALLQISPQNRLWLS